MAIDKIPAALAAREANERFGQWMPEQWLWLFVEAYNRIEARKRLYRPTSGTEGECFAEDHCYQCKKHSDPCPIRLKSMAYEVTAPEYPREWTFDENEEPICTAFERQAPAHG